MKIQIKLQTFIIVLLFSTHVLGQVTIGSNLSPVSGALLDLKEESLSMSGATSHKGLGLPRVALIDKSELLPMLSDADAASGVKNTEHAGLLVYNMHQDLCDNLLQGIALWDGSEWIFPSTPFPAQVSTLVDTRDPNNVQTYRIGKFGDQWWMLENLRAKIYDTNSNSTIQIAAPPATQRSVPTWAYPSLNPNFNSTGAVDGTDPYYFDQMKEMGLLYNWYAALGFSDLARFNENVVYQGICPNGWHVPSAGEFQVLTDFLNADIPCNYSTLPNDLGSMAMFSSTKLPYASNESVGHSRTYSDGGINVMPVGFISSAGGTTLKAGDYGVSANFWSSSLPLLKGYATFLYVNNRAIGTNTQSVPNNYYSVRCIKN